MKKILAMVCSVVILAAIAISGTIAYFTDSDSATNVFTVGNVVIDLIEQQRGENGVLEDFKQEKNLMPLVGTISATDVDGKGLPTARNFQDKIVTVKNTGKSDAYVRVYVGVPKELDEKGALHFVDGGVYNTKSGTAYKFTTRETDNVLNQTVDGVAYNFYCFTLNGALPKGETTGAAIVGFYLDSKVDYDDADGDLTKAAYYIGDKSVATNKLNFNLDNNVNIPVYVQAVQTAGFDKAETAFTAAFEGKTPWGGTLPPTSAPSATPTPGPTVMPTMPTIDENGNCTISSAAELFGFAEAVNEGKDGYANNSNLTVTLTQDIVLNNQQPWETIGYNGDEISNKRFSGTFDGGNHTIYHLYINMDSIQSGAKLNFGLFGPCKGTIQNLKIAGAKIELTDQNKTTNAGFIAAALTEGGKISNCSVTNSEISCSTTGNNNMPKVGGIVGSIDNGTLENCSVSDCTLWGQGEGTQAHVGGIAGTANVEYNAISLKNCTVSRSTMTGICSIYSSDDTNKIPKVGGIAGAVGLKANPALFILQNCKVNDCTIRGMDAAYTGTIVGRLEGSLQLVGMTYINNEAKSTTASTSSDGENYTTISAEEYNHNYGEGQLTIKTSNP